MRLFVFGLGYTALELARQLDQSVWEIAGTCRSEEKKAELEREGFTAHVFDGSAPLDPTVLEGTTHILDSIPPKEGDPALAYHASDIAALSSVEWVGYLSTTGVYGDTGGDWVDETSPVQPSTDRGTRRAEAEDGWMALWHTHGTPVHIFRLPGIYGPGRNQLETVKDGKARRIVKEGQVFSRIHVEDLATALRASMGQPSPGEIFNICDDEPAPPQDVIAYAAKLLGVEPPPEVPFEDAEMSEMARSFYSESKRVQNRKMKEMLGVELAYPTYREGL
ncbi:MAG: SDR family oxidoreductase, partial [Alphaproteobacteria bacterium]|nr:SDR family oxidoreductase [Alphaproteobacteria bacterium]